MVSQKSWRLDLLIQLFAFLIIGFSVGMFTAGILRHFLGKQAMEDDMLSLILSILCLHGTAALAIAVFVYRHDITWSEAFGFKYQPGWSVALGICVGVVALPVCWWLEGAVSNVLAHWGFDVSEQDAVRVLRMADSLWKQVVLGVFTIAVAPVVEEMFFRGIIYTAIKQKGHPQVALWATALLFALIHGNAVAFVPLLILALALALLYEWTGNLLSCIVVHCLFNTANFVMLFAQKYSWHLPGTGTN
jgi:membrane protease YdiL (CAAX protease family)